MKVLLIKTSSLGDVIHTLPAVTDAKTHRPDIQFDWVVEEAFAEIPAWHPAIHDVIPVALRRWRQSWWHARRSPEYASAKSKIQRPYDRVLDAQGLLKSALLTRWNKNSPRYGLDKHSAREPIAAWFYHHPLAVAKGEHAITRVRKLFALAFDYEVDLSQLDYGLHTLRAEQPDQALMFFHATTWRTKHWPEVYWVELTQLAMAEHYTIWLPWGNEAEHQRAQRIAAQTGAQVLPKMNLTEVAQQLGKTAGVIGVDTGLCHLAAALEIPSVTLYGATQPALTGTQGLRQHHLQVNYACAPCLKRTCSQPAGNVFPVCYETLNPDKVWQTFREVVLS